MSDSAYFVARLKSGTMRYDKKTGRVYSVPDKKGRRPPLPDHLRGNSYVGLCACDGPAQHRAPAHIVVWEFFNGPIPDGMEVHHKDGVRHHNRIENLALVTRSQNVTEGIKLNFREKVTQSRHDAESYETRKIFEMCRMAYKDRRVTPSSVTSERDRA